MYGIRMISRLYPITFSISEDKITKSVPIKTKVVSDLIPGKLDTYIYNNETDYYNEYKKSLFAITIQKGGWDCLRHYEILANGCIPYFPNIENCPINTLALLPKNLLLEGNLLYTKYKDKHITEFKPTELNECNTLIESLLDYTKLHLTSSAMAQYILDTSKNRTSSKILFLSGETGPDYLRCLTLYGFKTMFGTMCHDYPKIEHIYKNSTIDYSKLYGKGITYTNLLNSDLHDTNLDKSIIEDIYNKSYDLIIYGSYHRGMSYYDIIKEIYEPNKIIMLCGEDTISTCSTNHMMMAEKGHHVFVREL